MYSLPWYTEHLQYILKYSEFDFLEPTTTSIFFFSCQDPWMSRKKSSHQV